TLSWYQSHSRRSSQPPPIDWRQPPPHRRQLPPPDSLTQPPPVCSSPRRPIARCHSSPETSSLDLKLHRSLPLTAATSPSAWSLFFIVRCLCPSSPAHRSLQLHRRCLTAAAPLLVIICYSPLLVVVQLTSARSLQLHRRCLTVVAPLLVIVCYSPSFAACWTLSSSVAILPQSPGNAFVFPASVILSSAAGLHADVLPSVVRRRLCFILFDDQHAVSTYVIGFLPALPILWLGFLLFGCKMSDISSDANTSSFVSSGEMKSSLFSSIITKMNGGNYEMWAMQVKRTLIAHDKEYLIVEPEPVQKVGKYTTWFKDNSLVMVWIVGTLTQEIANEVLHKESAKDMWDFLAATYSQARNETRIMQLHHYIHQMRQDGRPLHTYYSSLKSMFERLNSYFLACKCEQQKAYRDMLMVGVFLSGLDSLYESAKNQMLTSPSIPPIDEAYSRLSKIPIPAATVPDTTSAMLATRGRGESFFARGRGGRGCGNTSSRPVCQFCHRIGHTVDKCWQKHFRPAFANQTASTEFPEQPKAQHTAPSSELRVDDLLSQLRSLIGDRPQHAPDPTTSTITTAASASSSGMYSAYTVCPATDTTDWLIDSGASTHLCLSPEYAAAKDQMLTGSEIPELSDAYNRLSRLAISLSQPTSVTSASALVVGGGRGHGGSPYSARGRGIGRGTGGRGRFQCTYCGKIGHLEDRCWDKHGRPSLSQGRNMVTKQGKSPTHSSMGSAQIATPTVEDASSSTVPETVTVSIDRVEYEQFLAHKASHASASTALTDRAFSVGPSTSDSDGRLSPVLGYGDVKLSQSMTISHVLYAPDFPSHLLSVKQLTTELHCRVIFDPGSCSFQDLQTGKTIGGGYEKGGVYILSAPMGLAATSSTSEPTVFQWHLRLGHPSVPKLRSLLPNLSVPESFQSFETKEAYYKMIGYKEDGGNIESTDSYLQRLEAYMTLYAALIQTEIPGIANQHGLKEGWAWLARFLNVIPADRTTATALVAFLRTAGHALYRRYGNQFIKILRVTTRRFLPDLKGKEDPLASKVINNLETYLQSKEYLSEPKGLRFAQTVESKDFGF
ncbi:GLE1 protein, partial [Nymphaea thermarum]